MRGLGQDLTIGERISWYRRRRGLSQDVLAGIVGRTVDWLSKVENNRIDLDRLSVIRTVAEALDVSVGDLVGEPTLLEWTADSGTRTVSAIRDSLLNYRQLSPFAQPHAGDAPSIAELRRDVDLVWRAYQDSRYGYVVSQLPGLLSSSQRATAACSSDDQPAAFGLLGLTYQVTAVLLTKLGEAELAWIAAERGLTAAQRSEDKVVIGSLLRAVTHTLQSSGRFAEATQLTRDALAHLQPGLAEASPEYLSVYGTLLLAGSVAAARADDRGSVQDFLQEADETARRLGGDRNHLWTAFGPTNVSIHRVTAAMDLGDIEFAADLGRRIQTTAMPVERRVRHSLEVARALSAKNRTDEALAEVLEAEQIAPEQVRHHAISRQLVQTWMRRGRSRPGFQLVSLAQRVRVTA
ncbi:helix-turn-helix domain-containing protein [Micromonosporaceae bacterium Da 78-11]